MDGHTVRGRAGDGLLATGFRQLGAVAIAVQKRSRTRHLRWATMVCADVENAGTWPSRPLGPCRIPRRQRMGVASRPACRDRRFSRQAVLRPGDSRLPGRYRQGGRCVRQRLVQPGKVRRTVRHARLFGPAGQLNRPALRGHHGYEPAGRASLDPTLLRTPAECVPRNAARGDRPSALRFQHTGGRVTVRRMR